MNEHAARKALRDEAERLIGKLNGLRIEVGRLCVAAEDYDGRESRLMESAMQDLSCASSALHRAVVESYACEGIKS